MWGNILAILLSSFLIHWSIVVSYNRPLIENKWVIRATYAFAMVLIAAALLIVSTI